MGLRRPILLGLVLMLGLTGLVAGRVYVVVGRPEALMHS